jgi:hypothetical protein
MCYVITFLIQWQQTNFFCVSIQKSLLRLKFTKEHNHDTYAVYTPRYRKVAST